MSAQSESTALASRSLSICLFVGTQGSRVALVGVSKGDARRWKNIRWWRQRCSLLLAGYKYSFWWYESVDLIRKVVLASVVLVVQPNTRLQLWFGSIVAAVSLMTVIQMRPYQSVHCQCAQTITQVQILFTYLASQVFFHDPGAHRLKHEMRPIASVQTCVWSASTAQSFAS